MRSQLKMYVGLLWMLCSAAVFGATTTLKVNGRDLVLPTTTAVIIDDQPGELWQLIGQPAGRQMRWVPQGRGGPVLVFSYTLIGPVTRLQPLEVLGQAVTLTGDTVLEGFTGPTELLLGTPMLVAGLVDQNGSLYSTLAVRRGAPGNKYLLSGYVQEHDSVQQRLRVGQQWLSSEGVSFVDCPTPLPAIGSYLEIRANAVTNFQPGSTLNTVTSARCATAVALGTIGATGVVDGLVQLPTSSGFALDALQVQLQTNTSYLYGTRDDLDIGVEVIVEGVFTGPDTLDASLVEFVRPVVRFEAPMTSEDISLGTAIRPFGVTVRANPLMRDEQNLLGAGLPQAQQVQVRGWLDRFGAAHALRVRTRGNPDPTDVSLRAPVAAISAPLIFAQGLTIDTSGVDFFDANGNALSVNNFFAALQVNQVIDLSQSTWTPSTRTLRGGALVLLGFEHTQPLPPPTGAFLSGTVNDFGTETSLFHSGFE